MTNRILAVLRVALLAVPLSCFGDSAQSVQPPVSSVTIKKADKATCEALKKSGASGKILAQRGCCSSHKGVCGCSGGRVVCCDQTYSPSCMCNHDDPKGKVN